MQVTINGAVHEMTEEDARKLHMELAGGDGDCLKGNLKLARADADHFLELLRQ